tara:strand:- start:3904 stop:4572 length:669 start_codon:yes stop_codon:yes gene_type:complete
MILSKRTINILKNFSTINQSVLFTTGNTVRTINQAKTLMAQTTLAETFPFEFGIYDLNQFLGVVSLFDEPALDFNQKYVTVGDEETSSDYFYTDKSMILTPPEKSLELPDRVVTFEIKDYQLKKILQGANVLQLPDIVIAGDKKTITVNATDNKNPTSNNYKFEAGDTDKSFCFIVKAELLRLLPHSYDVSISSKKMIELSSAEDNIKYWIAATHDSKYYGE